MKESPLNIKLTKYDDSYEKIVIDYIVSFFGFHLSLNGKTGTPEKNQAKENLALWTGKEHELYIIQEDCLSIGFLHIWYKGGNVAWIEDVFVEKPIVAKELGAKQYRKQNRLLRKRTVTQQYVWMLFHEILRRLTCTKSWDMIHLV